jgi:hypothetical protein
MLVDLEPINININIGNMSGIYNRYSLQMINIINEWLLIIDFIDESEANDSDARIEDMAKPSSWDDVNIKYTKPYFPGKYLLLLLFKLSS